MVKSKTINNYFELGGQITGVLYPLLFAIYI